MADTELQQFIVMDDVTIPLYCFNISLSAERLVKPVVDASKAFSGPKSRDRFIRARIASHQLMPRFESFTRFNL